MSKYQQEIPKKDDESIIQSLRIKRELGLNLRVEGISTTAPRSSPRFTAVL
jgi:hypothetical protein